MIYKIIPDIVAHEDTAFSHLLEQNCSMFYFKNIEIDFRNQ